MKNSLIIGCARTEIINHVVSLPKGNEEVKSVGMEQILGGDGFHLAYILQTFSFPYELIAPAGTGVYADFVRTEAEKYNIDIAYDSDETDGCVYRMIDQEGKQSVMFVPGGEYTFDREYLQLLDSDAIDRIIIFSEMLNGTYGMELLEASSEFDKPVCIVLNGDVSEMDAGTKHAIINLEPELILYDSDLFYLNGEKQVSLDEAAEAVHKETGKNLYVIKAGEGCYVYDTSGGSFYEYKKLVQVPAFAAFLIAALTAGADQRSALNYAFESAEICQNDMLNEDIMQDRKKRLAEVIARK